ncbi:MAG TPA: putative zinc-binding peptidase [Pseudolabrys sp.]|jgi:hypothetical protein
MKLFECQHCGQPLYFENTRCESCGHKLGYLSDKETITALEEDGDAFRALAEPKGRYRYCANARFEVCNWLVPAGGDAYCAACRHNRTIPDQSVSENLINWRKIEIAKHRLFYTLLRLRLPLATKQEDPNGLAFDFVASSSGGPLMTGHANGLITINISEADDAERERQRKNLAEPYRTLLGHFRHEIAHYYWDRLIRDSPSLVEFRQLFGDERPDYGQALQAHYANGPVANWPDHYVTAYASSHPWEDFAETWAHYFHMVDTLETANAFGMRVRPRVSMGADLATSIDFDPHLAGMERIIDSWLPLTFAMNSINRSMGMADLYPFVLAPPVIVKLSFVHDRIHAAGGRHNPDQARDALRAVVAGLKRPVGTPEAI